MNFFTLTAAVDLEEDRLLPDLDAAHPEDLIVQFEVCGFSDCHGTIIEQGEASARPSRDSLEDKAVENVAIDGHVGSRSDGDDNLGLPSL